MKTGKISNKVSVGILFLTVVPFYSTGQTGQPNVVLVLADEWRAQDTGYNGNRDVMTPNLDKLARQSVNFSNAISGCPVCCPYRASLMTGQYPLTTGVFVNDVMLDPDARSLGKIFKEAGYQTAYIGKWHLDGHGRNSFIPAERRQGFDYWKVLECTHDYFHSFYWGIDDKMSLWEGYDAFAQTADAIEYLRNSRSAKKPFLLILSWGPPHTPFETAPASFKNKYVDKILTLRKNVPSEMSGPAKTDLTGYYGHISALDSCLGLLNKALSDNELNKNTIFIFTSDHGAMVRSHGFMHKQRPYEESINVPLLIRYPKVFGTKGSKTNILINTPDLMPTLLGICGLPIPGSVEGIDRSPVLRGEIKDSVNAVLIACYHAFGQFSVNLGGKEFRGVRTKRYTYVKDLQGPWLLFDNLKDPFQLMNLVDNPQYSEIKDNLEKELLGLLNQTGDQFLPGPEYIRKWNYLTDKTGTVPYQKVNYQGLPVQ